MTSMRLLSTIVCCALGACAPSSGHLQPAASSVATTRLFAFHSNVWVNLHHFLYVTSRARAGLDPTRPAVTAALADTVGIGALSKDQRDVWNDALAYYGRAVAAKDILFDSSLVAVNNRLAELEQASTLRGATGLDPDIAAALDRAS